MPQYRITAPTGETYDVTAPEGASQDQVMAYVQSQHAQASAPAAQDAPAQPAEPSLFQRVNDFGNNMGDAVLHHLENVPMGAAQLVGHGITAAADAVLPASSGIRQSIDQTGRNFDANATGREDAYQKATPTNVASLTGATIGEALPWMTGIGEARAAGLIPKAASRLGRLGMTALEGGAMGLTQPVTSGNYAAQKAVQTGLGALAAPLAEGATLGGKTLLSTLAGGGAKVAPLDRAAAGILTREAESPALLGNAAPSQVPGVTRTLAEETLDPGIARLERNLRSTNKSFDAQDRSNNAARVSELEKIAGSDADYANANTVRDKVTGSIRSQAMSEGARYDAQRAQTNLMRRAVAQGSQINSTKGPLEARIDSIVQSSQGRPSVLNTLAVVNKAIQNAGDSVGGLYNVRKEIGDMLAGRAGADTAAAQSATKQLMGVRDAIDEELTRRAPSFSRYLTSFQDFSKPINRMDIGRNLIEPSSGSAVLDPVTGAQVLTPAQFSKKARDLDNVAARATGFAKAKATDILSPSDIATIKAVQDDLERVSFRATAGSGGNSQTFERQAMQDRITKGAGREALRHVPVVGRYAGDFLDMIDKSRNERVKERLAYLVANPAEARRVLSSLNPAGKKVVNDALLSIGAPAGRLASTTSNSQPSQ